MTLRNAFDGLATESSLRRIANLLGFARDTTDRLRVVVESSAISLYNRSSGNAVAGSDGGTWYNATSWNTVDSRDPLRWQHRNNFNYVRQTRWTF